MVLCRLLSRVRWRGLAKVLCRVLCRLLSRVRWRSGKSAVLVGFSKGAVQGAVVVQGAVQADVQSVVVRVLCTVTALQRVLLGTKFNCAP